MHKPQHRILLSINTSWNLYHFRRKLILALQEAGYCVITAAPCDEYTDKLKALVDEHYDLPMQNDGTSPLQDARLFWRYITLFRHVRPDVFCSFTIKPNIYGTIAARLCRIPSIANVSGLGTTFITQNWLTRLVSLLYKLAFACADIVYFQNPEDQQLFIDQKLVAQNKTALLPGSGVDLSHFNPDYIPSGKGGRPVHFVLIARLLWDKGIGEYVEAVRKLKQHWPDVQCQLVGPTGIQNKTAITPEIIQQWQQEGVIDYLGKTEDVREVMAQADCVVLPSYREGLSRVLLEAAAMGKPMIATDVPGCRQIVRHGINGFVCQPRNAVDLAKQMRRFMDLSGDERQQMGRASRAIAEQEYGEQLVFDRYLCAVAALLCPSVE